MRFKVSKNTMLRYKSIVTNDELYEFATGLKELLDDEGSRSLDMFINGKYGIWEHEQEGKKFMLSVTSLNDDLLDVEFTHVRNYRKKG